MNRSLAVLLIYVVLGTVFTLGGYWLVFGGTFTAGGGEGPVGGLVLFVSIALNTALAFAAAGVVAVVMVRSHVPLVPVLVASAVVAGAIGLLMSFWFAGVSIWFPVVMALGGAVCALVAKFAGFFAPAAPHEGA